MRSGQWRWASASTAGTSHLRRNAPSDDFGAAFEITRPDETILVQTVSDGAGSAPHARLGARLACCTLAKALKRALARMPLSDISDEDITGWIDDVRDRISHCAAQRGATPRSFAATVVCAVIGRNSAIVTHIGDGAFVYSKRAGFWRIASWPTQGHYAGTTHFVTDEVLPPIAITRINGRIAETALFSDGLERLALSFEAQKPFAPFFETMIGPLRKSLGTGRERILSKHLARFLDSPVVNARTDDDKTLILAKRLPRR
jgi:hypothetical protein